MYFAGAYDRDKMDDIQISTLLSQNSIYGLVLSIDFAEPLMIPNDGSDKKV